MNLDLEQLKHTKAALLTEVAKIDTLIKAVEEYTAKTTPSQTPAPEPAPQQPHRYSKQREPFTQGHGKQVVMMLYTGSASEKEIASALNWNYRLTHQTIGTLLRFRIIEATGSVFTLTAHGVERAKWFQKHPHMKVYAPRGTN